MLQIQLYDHMTDVWKAFTNILLFLGPGLVVIQVKTKCFELIEQDAALVQSPMEIGMM